MNENQTASLVAYSVSVLYTYTSQILDSECLIKIVL